MSSQRRKEKSTPARSREREGEREKERERKRKKERMHTGERGNKKEWFMLNEEQFKSYGKNENYET